MSNSPPRRAKFFTLGSRSRKTFGGVRYVRKATRLRPGRFPSMRMGGKSIFSGGIFDTMKSVVIQKGGMSLKFVPNFDFTRRANRARTNAMNHMGAVIRLTARRSMRPGFKRRHYIAENGQVVFDYPPSDPGKPPKFHTRHPYATLRNIRYDYNHHTDTLMVGIMYFKRSYGTTVPSVHEHGKTVTRVKMVRIRKNRARGTTSRAQAQSWKRMVQQNHQRVQQYRVRQRAQWTRKSETVHFPQRPIMSAALEKLHASGKLVSIFGGTFRRNF